DQVRHDLRGLLQGRGRHARCPARRRLAALRRRRPARRGRIPHDHRPQEGHPRHRRRQERRAPEPRERVEDAPAGLASPRRRRPSSVRRCTDHARRRRLPRAGGGRRRARRRGRQPGALALRADQAFHDPAARLQHRRRRGHADTEAEAARLPGALRRRDRGALLLTDAFLVASAFLASAVEMVEALTIVLAMGVTRGWRSALIGAVAATVALAAIVAALGPALTVIPIEALRLVVGALLLVFGLQWLRKAILRASGWRALRDEDAVL